MPTNPNDVELLEWERTQPDAITKDPLWTLDCYRESLFLVDAAREDAHKLARHESMATVRGQLLSSVGSIAANIAEGYGRMTAADRSKFLSYALGSAREAITWYRAVRPIGQVDETSTRIDRLARIRRMLIGLLKRPGEGGGPEISIVGIPLPHRSSSHLLTDPSPNVSTLTDRPLTLTDRPRHPSPIDLPHHPSHLLNRKHLDSTPLHPSHNKRRPPARDSISHHRQPPQHAKHILPPSCNPPPNGGARTSRSPANIHRGLRSNLAARHRGAQLDGLVVLIENLRRSP